MFKNLTEVIIDQTNRALWEVKNVIDCVPDEMWSREYCDMPLYKHIYHTLHSLDMWYINPRVYTEPEIHVDNLNNLDITTEKFLSRAEINEYYDAVKIKIIVYAKNLDDSQLLEHPQNCPHSRFKLILGQFRHLHTHMGMIMRFIIEATGQWPTVLGLEHPIPKDGNYSKFC